MIPPDVQEFTTEGERRFYTFLKTTAKPDSQYIAWYTPDIHNREPDFILFSHKAGLIIFEVKDWVCKQFQEANPRSFILNIGGRTESKKNPYQQAREYLASLMDKIKADGRLVSQNPDHFGNPKIPLSCGVVFPNITRHEYLDRQLDKIIHPDRVFFWDDLHAESPLYADTTGKSFSDMLQSKFPPPFTFSLTGKDLNSLKTLLFPEIKIELPARHHTHAYAEQHERLRMLDSNQEAIARKFDSGHRIIIGPSGSGKTIILVHKAVFLKRYNPRIKTILFVCYNITLVNYIKRLLADKGVALGQDGVEVMHFFELCGKLLNEKIHYEREDQSYYETVTALALDRIKDTGTRYDAILIDEAQDFSDDMIRVVILSPKFWTTP